MPRNSDLVRLSKSEESALSTRGYEISAKLGEGAYAKVYMLYTYLTRKFENLKFFNRHTGIPKYIQTKCRDSQISV